MITKTRIVAGILELKHKFEAKGFETKFLYIGRETWVSLGAEIESLKLGSGNPILSHPELTELEIVIVNRPKWLAIGVILSDITLQ